jgi:hypothetical protein
MNAEELEKRIDELALEFAKTHDEEVKAELQALRGRVAAMKGRLIQVGVSGVGSPDSVRDFCLSFSMCFTISGQCVRAISRILW